MACDLVISGWYSSDEKRNYVVYGDDAIRSSGFRSIWYNSLNSYISPKIIFVVDSNSPVKPSIVSDNTRVVELMTNPGHSQNTVMHYCGYMAGVLMGMEYALHSGVDYVLYVEQDVLLFGDKILLEIENSLLRHDYVFGSATSGDIQQSLFAINRRGMRKFISSLGLINFTDRQLSPELKFALAASGFGGFNSFISLMSWDGNRIIRKLSSRIARELCKIIGKYGEFNFGYGRERPINFSDDKFYFQHGNADEIGKYIDLTGFGSVARSR